MSAQMANLSCTCPATAQIAGWASFKQYMKEENELELGCLDADWRMEQRDFLLHSCLWQQIDPSEIIGTRATLLQFDVGSVTQADIATFTSPFRMEITDDAEVSGFGSWFDTAFNGSEASPVSHPVLLTTAPPSDTHWGQQARASTRCPASCTSIVSLAHIHCLLSCASIVCFASAQHTCCSVASAAPASMHPPATSQPSPPPDLAQPSQHPRLLTRAHHHRDPLTRGSLLPQVLLLHPPQPALAGDVLQGEFTLGRQPENHRLLWVRMTLRHTRPLTGEQVYPDRILNYRVD
jgi:hypothetical protein